MEGVCGSKLLVGWTLDVPLRSCSLVLCVLAFYPPAGSLISASLCPTVHVHPPPLRGFSFSSITFSHFRFVVCDLVIHILLHYILNIHLGRLKFVFATGWL